jgi:starch synthase
MPLVGCATPCSKKLKKKTPEKANGFVFSGATAEELFSAIQRAIALFQNKEQWKKLQLNAMGKDFSWDVSAKDYIAIYKKITADKQ